MAKIKIPADAKGAKFPDNWRRCVGTGHMGLVLEKEYQDLLEIVQESIGFDYIRGHGILSDGVGLYRAQLRHGHHSKELKEPFYNYTYIDRIYDSFLEQDIRPFVELGFMPGDLASGEQTVFYWKGNVTPPRDYEQWQRLIKNLVRHLVSRYGIDEVKRWPFEVWNEPNLHFFWKDADQAEYFRLYRETARAIKEVDADIPVGGPATSPASPDWITAFLQMCDKEKVPVDFIAHHAYCGKKPEYFPHVTYQDVPEATELLRQFKAARQIIKDSPFPDLPLHITEYNTSYSPICPLHDTAYNAAYLARTLSEGGDYVDSFAYWTFCDVFAEGDIPKSQFHGGFGLVALNGILKPTFHLYAFFAALGDEQLYRDEHLLVTRRDGTIAFVAWNEVKEKGTGFERKFDLQIPVNSPDVLVKRYTVNEEKGNAWNVWREMGRPRFPSREQVRVLQHAAVPGLEIRRSETDNGFVNLKFTLSKNEVSLFEICPLLDETSTYEGLDDSKIPGY